MTIYSLDQILDRAQEVLDIHTIGGREGRCLACGTHECGHREAAIQVFSRYRWMLPRRLPGASHPEELSARRVYVPKPAGQRGFR